MDNAYIIDEDVKAKATWIEDDRKLDKNDRTLSIPPTQKDIIDYVLITRKEVLERCKVLAKQIFEDHKGKSLLVVIIATGGFQFFNYLNEAILDYRDEVQPASEEEDVRIEYMFKKLSSYINYESLGVENVRMQESTPDEYAGKNVLIVEDIYDTGASMEKMISTIKTYDPATVKTAILLHKRNVKNLAYNYTGDYVGFWCPNVFVLGFGMDFNEYLRDLRHICISSCELLKKYEK